MLCLAQLTEYRLILPVLIMTKFSFSRQQHNSQKLTILRICLSGVAENILNCDKSRKNKINRKDKDLKTYKTLGIKVVQGSLRSANQKGVRGILKSFYHPNIQSRCSTYLKWLNLVLFQLLDSIFLFLFICGFSYI